MATISPFHATLPDLSDIISFDDFFLSAKRKYSLFLTDGIYEEEATSAFYIYRIQRPHRSYTGIISTTDIQDLIAGNIKKHENTLAAKEAKMMYLFKERTALIKPILLTYPNKLPIDALINRITASTPPSIRIPFQDEIHLFWRIDSSIQIKEIEDLFMEHVPQAYVCDGHHRIKTAENLHRHNLENNLAYKASEAYNNMLTAYFPASEIEVHRYNRMLLTLKELSSEDFLKALGDYYTITTEEQAFSPISKRYLGLCLENQWYRLQLKAEFEPEDNVPTNESLDVHILNELVLKNILGIQDVRSEPNIKYIEGPKGAANMEKKVRDGKVVAAFNLYPVTLEDLIRISDEEDTLPPKSTWIEPRMRNGFITQLYKNTLFPEINLDGQTVY